MTGSDGSSHLWWCLARPCGSEETARAGGILWGWYGAGRKSWVGGISARALQRNRTNMMWTCMERFILRNRIPWLWGAGESEICRACWQAGDPGKGEYSSSSPRAIWRQNSLFFRGPQNFFPLRASVGWMRPTHTMENNLPYSKSDWNVSLILNIPS